MKRLTLMMFVAMIACAVGAVAMSWADAPATNPATGPAGDLGSDNHPIAVPQLPDAITVDGDPAKWDKIEALPAPFAKKDHGSVKLAWRDDGLYGLVQVKDSDIKVDTDSPWAQDALEFWVETDDAKADSMTDNADQIVFTPDPKSGAGKALVTVIGNVNPDAIKASWKPITGGYAIEFFIPAKELAPAKFEAGTKIGLSYSIDDKGTPTEQFYCEKNTDDSYKTPKNWGTIQLGK